MYIRQWIGFLILISIYGVYSSMEIARGKQTKSSSTYSAKGITFKSSLAVDGNTSNNLFCGSCMHTIHGAGHNEAYLIITLNGTFSITLVEIFYRDQYSSQVCGSNLSNLNQTNYRFKGYSIHVSNTTNFRDGTTCYRDTSDPYPPLHVNSTCMGTGSYLTVYNNNTDPGGHAQYPVLELCEVKVYGCMVGYFGPQCSSRCSNCKDDSCDPDSGVCTYGCKDGWLGNMCNAPCSFGFYGENCSAVCGKCIRNETCDHVAGNCTDCARGYQSSLCDKECDDKKYGFNCNETCGYCLNSEACDIYDGSCGNGCELGWTGTLCKKECTNRTFGYNCNETCGKCMDEVQCNRFNGSCPNGCDAGWRGNRCKTECQFGFHGKDCLTKCGSCDNNETCNRFSGICGKGCSEGFRGSLCNDTCQNKTYGKNCNNTCGNCIGGDFCDIYNGTCIQGCAAGWKSSTCKDGCSTGEYGLDCKETCGNCLNVATCNRFNGTCINGCSAGWNGSLCNEECIGWYGQNCQTRCSENCKGNSSCNPISGICLQGCNIGFSGLDCTTEQRKSSDEEQTGSSGAAIGGGVAAAILAVVVILAVIFFIRRRRQGNGRNKGPSFDEIQERNNHSISHKKNENVYENLAGFPEKQNSLATAESLQSLDDDTEMETAIDDEAVLQEDEQVYMNQGGISKIRVSDIREVIARKKEGKVFEAEYKGLPKGLKHPHNEGTKLENKMKNRYLTTFPYDHSLVRISKEKGKNNSDYINANYIDSVQGKRDYIATQGPKVGTNSDFWKMAWETESGKIVMLTNVVELGKKKCEMYWPEDSSSPSNYGYFQIRLLDEKIYGSFAIRNLELKNTKTNETRMVGHFHFTSWPDHGTPDPIQLLMFYDIFGNAKTYAKGPSIVHCSAGIGRTGVFIGLDALLKGGRTEGEIDVYEFVNQMRYNRMNMIQTLDQYIFLHDALAEAFMLDGSTIHADDFTKKHQNATRNDVPKNKSKYKKEFQNLDGIRPGVNSDSAKEALSKENQSKNRSKNIIPDTKFRPLLYSQSEGRSNYINAVYLPTLRNKNGLIATQYPLKATVEDFWCLVYDHQSKIVVVLQPVDEGVPVYSATGKEIQHGSFVIQEKSCKASVAEGIKERKIQLKKIGDGSNSETLTILEVSSWRSGDVPQENLVDLIMEINSLQKECEDDPVTVVCPDGASRCGLFSVLYAALQSLTELNEVNIFQTARQMQLRRSQFLPSYEQYVFCYKAVNDHLENSNIYINTGS